MPQICEQIMQGVSKQSNISPSSWVTTQVQAMFAACVVS